ALRGALRRALAALLLSCPVLRRARPPAVGVAFSVVVVRALPPPAPAPGLAPHPHPADRSLELQPRREPARPRGDALHGDALLALVHPNLRPPQGYGPHGVEL